MTSKQPLLELEPSTELRFHGPFGNVVSTELVLTNTTNERVLFKIKTTAPRRYCVRPNSGHIIAGERAIITIMLQPQDFDPIAEKGKHKFMVQSCLAPADFAGDASIDQIWKETPTDRIFDSRLKCSFVEADGVGDNNTGKSVKSTSPELQEVVEARRAPTVEARADAKSTAVDSKSAAMAATGSEDSKTGVTAGQDKLATENERLRNQLVELQKQHAQLRQSELRLRNVAAQSSVSQATSTQPRIVSHAQSSSSLMFYVVIIVALIFGVLLGRFVL